MKTIKFTSWQDEAYYLGFMNDYTDYQAQGLSKEELVKGLKDLPADLKSGEVPYVRKMEELAVAENWAKSELVNSTSQLENRP